MYPNIPYKGLSWPITQHSGVISESIIRGLINACMLCRGEAADSQVINEYIVSHNLLTSNFRADSGQVDAWRDYQQILSEFGIIYSTRVSQEILLTPLALAYADGDISYQELMTLQILKYQYPNGHKSQLSPSLKAEFDSFPYESFTEFQTANGILVRPAVVVWLVLYHLISNGEENKITLDEMQTYVVRCLRNEDAALCAQTITDYRHNGISGLDPLPRARRNMQDWLKLLNITPLFELSQNGQCISLSSYSIEHFQDILEICKQLSSPESFWYYSGSRDYKHDWFGFYGEFDLNINLIPHEETAIAPNTATTSPSQHHTNSGHIGNGEAREVSFQAYTPISLPQESGSRQVVSIYDFKKSREGRKLHDEMVNIIAKRCVDKGAEVYYDSNTIDLYAKYKGNDFIVEVKSITPSNFVDRLRYAIGQVKQYDYMLQATMPRRLGLAFTAPIPTNSWIIPFVTRHLHMDLLSFNSNNLEVKSESQIANELYGYDELSFNAVNHSSIRRPSSAQISGHQEHEFAGSL